MNMRNACYEISAFGMKLNSKLLLKVAKSWALFKEFGKYQYCRVNVLRYKCLWCRGMEYERGDHRSEHYSETFLQLYPHL